jgi:hypothetical protein
MLDNEKPKIIKKAKEYEAARKVYKDQVSKDAETTKSRKEDYR